MTIAEYLRAMLAKIINRFADNSVESVLATFTKTAQKLEAIAAHHKEQIDRLEAQAAAIATAKLASADQIAQAEKVNANIRALLGR